MQKFLNFFGEHEKPFGLTVSRLPRYNGANGFERGESAAMDIQMYALRQDRPLRADERERLRAGLPQPLCFRLARKAAVKRDASLCAYAVLRAALYDLCGWETLPDMAYSERGKPYFPTYPGVHFSLSHSYGCILVGVHDRPLGVDIERFRPVRAERLRRVLGAETEEDFWRRWTEYESRCKRRGIGAAGQKGLLLPPVESERVLPLAVFSDCAASVCTDSGSIAVKLKHLTAETLI